MPRARVSRAAALPRLTRRGGTLLGGGFALFGITLWFDARDVMLLAFVGIALPIVSLAYVAFIVPRLAVRRSFVPAVVEAGGATRVVLTVQNRLKRAFDGASWRDTTPAGLLAPPESALPALGAWDQTLPSGDDSARLEYRIRTSQRGVYDVGPLRVTTTDPFGLARITRDAGGAQELVVTPPVTALDPAIGTAAAVDGALIGLQRRTHPNSDEFIAREYRHGDPLRRVHWPATARRGELMVRDEEQRGDPEARLLIDTALAGHADHSVLRGGAEDRRHFGFELAVEVAASVGVHLIERGFRVHADRLEDPIHGAISERANEGYRLPAGDRSFLEDLARLPSPCSPRRAAHDDAAVVAVSTQSRMPGYAVLVDPDMADAQRLAALRPAFSPAVAFVVQSVSSRIAEALEDADWHVVSVRRIGDLPDAWAEAGQARGASARHGVGRGADAS